MSKHTPGPWKERVATGIPDRMISGNGEGVCVVPYKYGTSERRAANARLIIAAPDLLSMLKRLGGDEPHTPELWDEARALVAKAEGK